MSCFVFAYGGREEGQEVVRTSVAVAAGRRLVVASSIDWIDWIWHPETNLPLGTVGEQVGAGES
jgi:hypothetical protein